jgi:RNA polymerase sigma-70 factor (ECF subfamily)
MCHCIRDLVSDLPLDYRTIIYLSELKELPIGEVGEILGISPGSAKIRLHRARRMLRARMEQDCRILLDEQADIQCDRKAEA